MSNIRGLWPRTMYQREVEIWNIRSGRFLCELVVAAVEEVKGDLCPRGDCKDGFESVVPF